MAKRVKDVDVVLHIGLHKTATTYVQNMLAARRYDLLGEGVLYPTAGTIDRTAVSTRDGAQSGHALFARPGDRTALVADLVNELPDSTSTVLLSAEDFTLPGQKVTPAVLLDRFSAFGSVKVVLVLRRQDTWLESVYKQIVDQYVNYETRSFGDYLAQVGPQVLDFHTRFSPWRDLVGPDSFHAISYDDVDGGAAIYRRLLEVAGVSGPLLEVDDSVVVPRYDSVRPVDTLGLRILNGYRLTDRETRIRVAKAIYDVAPAGEIELVTPQMREAIVTTCAPINERIEAEWFDEPVPGLRFGTEPRRPQAAAPTADELIEYVDRVIALCDAGRASQDGPAE